LNFLSLFKRNISYKLKKKISIDEIKFKKNTNLDFLFKYFQTDKSSKLHGFTKFYIKHFKIFENKRINFLEIGSATGASAASFVKFFKKSKAFCIDVNLTLVKYKSKKIRYFGLSISNIKYLNKFIYKLYSKYSVKKFDFIIDDGSHILSDQLKSINFFLKYVKPKGLYVVEDFKFPDYFSRCKDTDELTIDKLILKLKNRNRIRSKILENDTLNILKSCKIYKYKGNSKISDIVFFKRS